MLAVAVVLCQYSLAAAPDNFFSWDSNRDGCIDAKEFAAEGYARMHGKEVVACVTDAMFDMMGVDKYCPPFFDDEEASHAHFAAVRAGIRECFEEEDE